MDTTTHILSRVRRSLKTVKDPVLRERLLLVAARYETDSLRQAGERCGTSYVRVKRWTDRYEAGGLKGLETKPRSGRPALLAPEKANAVRRAVLTRGAREGWQTTQLRAYVTEQSGVTYSERHILRLAAHWGLSRITPRPRYAHSDEAERNAFLKAESSVSAP
jgi:transposase